MDRNVSIPLMDNGMLRPSAAGEKKPTASDPLIRYLTTAGDYGRYLPPQQSGRADEAATWSQSTVHPGWRRFTRQLAEIGMYRSSSLNWIWWTSYLKMPLVCSHDQLSLLISALNAPLCSPKKRTKKKSSWNIMHFSFSCAKSIGFWDGKKHRKKKNQNINANCI